MLFEDILANAPTPHEDGHFISAEVSRIVELIREYDPRLDVKWIPPEQRRDGDAAFTIVERIEGKEFPVFTVDTEEHFNENVLAAVYAADVEHNDVMGRIEASNAAARAADRARYDDQLAVAHDEAVAFLRSPLHTYRHNGKVYRR